MGIMKVQWSLISSVIEPIEQVVRVLQTGLEKYPDATNWRTVPRDKHVDAMGRHWSAFMSGQKADPDSNLHPLAHAACRALFIIWLDINGGK